jgi:hypothetical protein
MLSCTLDRDRDWREWEYPRAARLLDVYDATALVVETRDGGGVLRYYDIDMGRGTDIRLGDPAVEIARAGFSPDGRVVVLAASGTGSSRRSLIGIGIPTRVIELRPLGFSARDVDMADDRYGLAVGETAHDMAETRDGGINWLRIESIGLDGDPRRFQLFAADGAAQRNFPTPSRIGSDVQCSPSMCRVGRRLVHTWDRTVEIVPAMP